MKQHLSKIILGTELLASVLVCGSVFIWAPVCKGLLTLANGNMVHMKCFYTGQVSVVLALILMIAALAAFLSKTDHNKIQWVILAIGIMLIAITYESAIGIGICKRTTMAMGCNITAAWLRGSGILAIVSGLLDILANSSKTNRVIL